MIVLDTSILSYAVGGPHPLREPCRRLIGAVGAGTIDAAVTVEVLQEFTHVRTQRRTRGDAVALARHYRSALRVLITELEDLELGLDLFTSHARLGAFDAVLAAVAIRVDAEALVSADRAFGTVAGLRWVDPASPALDRLLT